MNYSNYILSPLLCILRNAILDSANLKVCTHLPSFVEKNKIVPTNSN